MISTDYLVISRQQDRNIVSGSIRHLDTTLCILSSCHNASLLQPITAPPSWQLYNRNGVLASPALENQSGPHIACTISTELQIVHCPCKLQQNINFDINECFSIQLTFSFDVHSFQSTVHCFSKYSFFIWKVIWISTFKCASTHYYIRIAGEYTTEHSTQNIIRKKNNWKKIELKIRL